MNRLLSLLKREPMLSVSVAAAITALIITPPTKALLSGIDWHTLATLFMMLTVLEGFKKENIFAPVLHFAGGLPTMPVLTHFLVFGVFFSSMFVTNDVSLIIFVPLTILLFREGGRERYILPVLTLENIAAVRGSLLTPFGSPQNLFIFQQSGISAERFISYMFPIWILSAALLVVFILFLYRKDLRESTGIAAAPDRKTPGNDLPGGVVSDGRTKERQAVLLALFVLILWTIVSRTSFWPASVVIVAAAVFFSNRELLVRTDYVLLLTFFCFFIFSSSVAANPGISSSLKSAVAHHEYAWSILLSQVISNVPASIVLYPFAVNKGALLYGLDSAGLCSLIGSLASVINFRIYVREYPGRGMAFIRVFTLISLAFFALVVLPGYFISRNPL